MRRPAERQARDRRGDAEVRAGARLPAGGARGARPVADLADAGLLADQLPGVAHLAGQSAGDLLQRQRAVAFIRGAPLVEVAAQDPVLGTVFYQLSQTESPTPRLSRSETCLSCHLSWDTRAVPGPVRAVDVPAQSRSRLRQWRHRRLARDARSPLRRLVRDRRAGPQAAHGERAAGRPACRAARAHAAAARLHLARRRRTGPRCGTT